MWGNYSLVAINISSEEEKQACNLCTDRSVENNSILIECGFQIHTWLNGFWNELPTETEWEAEIANGKFFGKEINK